MPRSWVRVPCGPPSLTSVYSPTLVALRLDWNIESRKNAACPGGRRDFDALACRARYTTKHTCARLGLIARIPTITPTSSRGSAAVSNELQFGILNLRDLHQVLLEAAFQNAAMHRDRDAGGGPRLHIDVVAASDPLQPPASRFDQPTELLSANGPHTAISMILSASETGISRTSTDKHPSTAS